jgi:hypothetical protein
MMKLIDLLKEEYGGGEYEIPKDHKAGLRVPKGGSCCANCEYWKEGEEGEKGKCINEYYIKWAGTSSIPYPPDQYCTDWWEPKKGAFSKDDED